MYVVTYKTQVKLYYAKPYCYVCNRCLFSLSLETKTNTYFDPTEVTIAAGATLRNPARASISRNAKFTSAEANANNEEGVARPCPQGKGTQHVLGIL